MRWSRLLSRGPALPEGGWPAQRVLLIGASGGIGQALVDEFTAAGARLLISGRRSEVLAALAERHPEQVTALAADLTRPAWALYRKLAPRVAQIHIKDALPAATPGQWGREVRAGEGAVRHDDLGVPSGEGVPQPLPDAPDDAMEFQIVKEGYRPDYRAMLTAGDDEVLVRVGDAQVGRRDDVHAHQLTDTVLTDAGDVVQPDDALYRVGDPHRDDQARLSPRRVHGSGDDPAAEFGEDIVADDEGADVFRRGRLNRLAGAGEDRAVDPDQVATFHPLLAGNRPHQQHRRRFRQRADLVQRAAADKLLHVHSVKQRMLGGRLRGLDGAQAGDMVSLHWDWACERLDRVRLAALVRSTTHELAIANQTI